MKIFTRSIAITILSLFVLTWFVPGISASSTLTLVLAGVVISLLNLTLRPLLKTLLLPINLITLGTLNWVINLFVLYLALWLVPGFRIWPMELLGMEFGQFWSLVIFSFFLSLSSSVIGRFL